MAVTRTSSTRDRSQQIVIKFLYTADSFGNNWVISYFSLTLIVSSLMKGRTPFLILLLVSLPAVHAEQSISAESASYYYNF